jgi:hypothetical protein
MLHLGITSSAPTESNRMDSGSLDHEGEGSRGRHAVLYSLTAGDGEEGTKILKGVGEVPERWRRS